MIAIPRLSVVTKTSSRSLAMTKTTIPGRSLASHVSFSARDELAHLTTPLRPIPLKTLSQTLHMMSAYKLCYYPTPSLTAPMEVRICPAGMRRG